MLLGDRHRWIHECVQGRQQTVLSTWVNFSQPNLRTDPTRVHLWSVHLLCVGDERSLAVRRAQQRVVAGVRASWQWAGALLLRHVRRLCLRAVHLPWTAAFRQPWRALIQWRHGRASSTIHSTTRGV